MCYKETTQTNLKLVVLPKTSGRHSTSSFNWCGCNLVSYRNYYFDNLESNANCEVYKL